MKFPFSPRHLTFLGVFFIVAVIAISLMFPYVPNTLKRPLISNDFTRHFVHAYHAIRKIPDIAFFPYWFHETTLPTLYLSLKESDMLTLERALPEDSLNGRLTDEHRVQVKGLFTDGSSYKEEVDVRYRGTNANHWNSLQRSWRINFPHNNLYHGEEGLNLIIPSDRGYLIELLNVYRAKKLGLVTPQLTLVRLNINGYDHGVYVASEGWSSGWIEKNALPANGIIYTTDDAASDFKEASVFTKEGARLWKQYPNSLPEASPISPEIQTLVTIIEETDDKTFARIIPHLVDLPKLYRSSVLAILAASNHQTNFNNSVLYFNAATGIFEPIPWDIGFGEGSMEVPYKESRALEQRVFAIPEFREARNAILKEYLDDPANLADDLAYYDTLVKTYRGEFLSDNRKLDNDMVFLSRVNEYRTRITNNMTAARLVLAETGTAQHPSGTKSLSQLSLPAEYQNLPDIVTDIDTFLATHPSFYKVDARTIGISGSRLLTDTVIIPAGYHFVMDPGTRITMGAKTSLVSYSPTAIRGTQSAPVTISAESPDRPFGSVLVLHTDAYGTAQDTSSVNWLIIRDGSGAHINGVISTGMLALHDVGTAEIANSSFTRSHDDDALNIKYAKAIVKNNYFHDTWSDAIDLDVPPEGSHVEQNTFDPVIGYDPDPKAGGDAIDISFANVIIRDNIVHGTTDKCISSGEHSTPVIIHNVLEHCVIGIAVKDLSRATITDNIIRFNDFGISLYRKKEIYGGAYAELHNNTITDNRAEIDSDIYSSYEIK